MSHLDPAVRLSIQLEAVHQLLWSKELTHEEWRKAAGHLEDAALIARAEEAKLRREARLLR